MLGLGAYVISQQETCWWSCQDWLPCHHTFRHLEWRLSTFGFKSINASREAFNALQDNLFLTSQVMVSSLNPVSLSVLYSATLYSIFIFRIGAISKWSIKVLVNLFIKYESHH